MSLETPSNTPERRSAEEGFLLKVRELHERAKIESAKVSVGALVAVDAVISKLHPDFQAFLIDSATGFAAGLPPITNGSKSEAQSLLLGLVGISAVREKFRKQAEK